MTRLFFLLLVLVLAPPGCADTATPPTVLPSDAATLSPLRAEPLPVVPLTGELLYRLLAAELAAQRGYSDLAARTLLELAQETQDPRLAQRALQFAALEQNAARAYAAARQWVALAPGSEQAAQQVLEYGLIVDPQATLQETRLFLRKYPQARRVHLHFIERLTARGALDEALAHLQDLQSQTPEDFDLLYVQAQVLLRAQRYDQAREALNTYIQIQTQRRQSIAQDNASDALASLADAQLSLVDLAEHQGDLDEAIALLAQIDDPTVQLQVGLRRAVLQGRQGQVTQARATLDALTPQDAQERGVIASTLAQIYRDSGRTDDAVQVLETALNETPEVIPMQYTLAMLYERQGRFEAFEERLQYILMLDPDNANANNALGYTLVDMNQRLDEAQALLARAERLEPDNPYILDSVGWYHYRRGDLAHALAYLRRAYDALPAADVAAHLGEVLWVMQRHDEARAIWQAGARLEDDNETLRNTLRRLEVTLP